MILSFRHRLTFFPEEISGLLTNEKRYCDRIEELNNDLAAFKSAFNAESRSNLEIKEKMEKIKEEADKNKHDLENQMQALRVDTIFSCLLFTLQRNYLGIR